MFAQKLQPNINALYIRNVWIIIDERKRAHFYRNGYCGDQFLSDKYKIYFYDEEVTKDETWSLT
jgi:hypothetical protein